MNPIEVRYQFEVAGKTIAEMREKAEARIADFYPKNTYSEVRVFRVEDASSGYRAIVLATGWIA